jgi:hypothetical protein
MIDRHPQTVQLLGGFALVSVASDQRFAEVLDFFFEQGPTLRGTRLQHGQQILLRDRPAVAIDEDSFHHVLQFPDVAGPVMLCQHQNGFVAHTFNVTAEFLVQLQHHSLDQPGDIGSALAQRRQVNPPRRGPAASRAYACSH